MRTCFFGLLVSVGVLGLANAQYDEPPAEDHGAAGNAYYENEAPPQYDAHHQDEGAREHHQPRDPLNQGRYQERSTFPRRTTYVAQNDTFTLPPYYYSITTTEKTIKINRRTYQQLLDAVISDGALKTPRVIEAFSKVDRGHFVHHLEDEPYGFMARKLGRGIYMEKPHLQARIIELLEPKIQEGAKVLDIGSGSGFMSCVFAELVGKTGRVFGVEHMREQCEDAWETVMRIRPDLLNDGRLHLRCRDGRTGLLHQAPFDAIYLSTYVPEIPYSILLQLKPGGRLVCGVGKSKSYHRMTVIDRSEDGTHFQKYEISLENFINPLINADEQNDNWLYQQSR
ncbi:protein-L-isoaspartate(D-aspartate) O-methyltransferase-like [Diaphorina citri]|uniref:protein-L-isoaspartate(D-aspartate) O-methyltransferase n=1 Tax=Diaphorina citri TaxID=121845 RepID=A0A1S3D3H5_DIACI|nr:protein-L-isoaspartate(D-aspartate) O-methyltransferase-like [Diaphorina citri]